MTVIIWGWLLLCLCCLSVLVLAWHGAEVQRSLDSAENLLVTSDEVSGTVDVIIPAYNEARNIEDCVKSVLQSIEGLSVQVWVADDQSTDETFAIAQRLAEEDARVHVVRVPPRPADQLWFGKTWACHWVAQTTESDYLLFIDADVLLNPGSLKAALQEAQRSQVDLLTVFPTVLCRFWAEWCVQPIVSGLILGFCNIGEINDPTFPNTVFGSGQFMFFRREAYQTIGGHSSVACYLVEDVALAKRIKYKSMKLRMMLAGDLFTVRMYANFSDLFEGWSKNLHFGFGRSILQTSLVAVLVVLVWSIPQLSLLAAIAFLCLGWLNHGMLLLLQGGLMFGISLLLQLMMFKTRSTLSRVFVDPLKYGFLTFWGGILVFAIMIASMIKTETGWRWTWRGRSLSGAHALSAQNFSD